MADCALGRRQTSRVLVQSAAEVCPCLGCATALSKRLIHLFLVHRLGFSVPSHLEDHLVLVQLLRELLPRLMILRHVCRQHGAPLSSLDWHGEMTCLEP